ncbi:MAG: hypothetical protein FJ388_04650 [Verrucomicrobia bacterium]|nr:hypothetical protein [Verrucomicrobiota bacterium]
MTTKLTRRGFVTSSVFGSAGVALAACGAQGAEAAASVPPAKPEAKEKVPQAKIGKLEMGRMLLGGNLLTHFTHSRDLRYVYALTKHYNTKEKIFETMQIAEAHGVNALVIHTAAGVLDMMKEYRKEYRGKMQWIICPTAPMEAGLEAFSNQIQTMVDDGTDAIYIWGVRSDALVAQGKVDLIAKAVDIVKAHSIMCGVGAHDLRAIQECEKLKVAADFYIKTLHHHNYPSGPKPEQITKPHSEHPGYWCSQPKETIEFMQTVEKPWIAFKVMAAGAIPPANAFRYAIEGGADFMLAGMFDFEIAEDVRIFNQLMASKPKRNRAWRA